MTDVAVSRPPWASTSPRLIHRPRPVPVGLPMSRRKNFLNTSGTSDAGMPSPVSLTATATSSSRASPTTVMPVVLAYFAAFSTRLVRTCSSLSGSAYTWGKSSANLTSHSRSVYVIVSFSTTCSASSERLVSWRRSTSRPVSRRLMSSNSVMSRVTRSASWCTCSSIIFFCSSLRRSQRFSSREV